MVEFTKKPSKSDQESIDSALQELKTIFPHFFDDKDLKSIQENILDLISTKNTVIDFIVELSTLLETPQNISLIVNRDITRMERQGRRSDSYSFDSLYYIIISLYNYKITNNYEPKVLSSNH